MEGDDNLDSTSPYIKLISAENSEIYLLRRIALQVETLRVMLEGRFRESEEGIIRFPDISTSALEKVVQYLHYKDRYSNSSSRIPEFVIDPEEVRRTFFSCCLVFFVVLCFLCLSCAVGLRGLSGLSDVFRHCWNDVFAFLSSYVLN